VNPAPRLEDWIGKSETREETIALEPALRFHATIDDEGPLPRAGMPLPPMWHWLYFLPVTSTREIGEDGHPRRGGFLPPVSLPRRMFAGSRIEFHAPLLIGERAVRHREVVSIERKTGREGPLIFVGVRERTEAGGRLCIDEHQTIVYREIGSPVPPPPAQAAWPDPPAGTWTRVVTPNSVLMFRFAALTFNAHRIHYDRTYTREVEGYPGLVVQGPLVAMLLMQLARQHTNATVTAFTFRARAPLFDLAPFRLNGREKAGVVSLWAERADQVRAMEAEARLSRESVT